MASLKELLEGSRRTLERAQQVVEAGHKRNDHAQGYIAAWRREKNKQRAEKSTSFKRLPR